ncbi:diaminopimelate epimerase protein (plasmid) [Rhizobium phaseoli]|nr:diaminopimelate epimerase protein [Rhizobium phaseoli]
MQQLSSRSGIPTVRCSTLVAAPHEVLLGNLRETGSSSVVVRTNRGLLTCFGELDGRISVDMGKPLLHWRDVPIAQEADTLKLPLPGAPSACSMGNPHCTFFIEDLEAVDVKMRGLEFESHPLFPQKTNVHFVQVISPTRIRLRIWERGGGIPLGSGSCSCGAVVNGIRRSLLTSSVDVECDGGTVAVRWDGYGGVFLTGPVDPNFCGTWIGELSQKS